MPRASTHAARPAAGGGAAARRAASRTRRAQRSSPAGRRSGSAGHAGGKTRAHAARAEGSVRPQSSAGAAAANAPRGPATASRRSAAPARPRGATVPRLPVRSANGILDGLLRGKVWVACVGVLLVGIVFLNVSLLGLNSGIAVTADQAGDLRRQNADLRMEVAKLASSERIQEMAEARGFVMPAPGDVTYVTSDPEADGRTAAAALGRAASEVAVEAPPADPAATDDAETTALEPSGAGVTQIAPEPAPPGAATSSQPVEPAATAAPAPAAVTPAEPPAG